ncbi:MAG: hypothetical protein IJ448_03820 [Oscillospiraceae bacterium]|nr:hypothetical protein [Oscillospiraceae bacterium]
MNHIKEAASFEPAACPLKTTLTSIDCRPQAYCPDPASNGFSANKKAPPDEWCFFIG